MKVKFTNERPETHYFNYIEADAIEHDKKSEIISDNNENYVPVYSKTNPSEASANGIDILSFINKKDNIGQTPLYLACIINNSQIVQMYLYQMLCWY